MSLVLNSCLVFIIYSIHISDSVIPNFISCATGIFTNRKYLSPINIDENKTVQIRANLVLNPDPIGNYSFTTQKNEQDGVLHILPDFPPNKQPTLNIKFFNRKFTLRDIHLFWGEVTTREGRQIMMPTTMAPTNSSKPPSVPTAPLAVDDGSEHSINEKFFPVEVRMVYTASGGNRFLGLNINTIVKVHFLKINASEGSEDVMITTGDIIPSGATALDKVSYVAYKGTATTKPRGTTVLWIISTTPGIIGQNAFQKLYNEYPDLHKRDRALIQHLCGRKLYKLLKNI